MIWSNVVLNLQNMQMSWGELRCLVLGKKGRGRKQILIPSNIEITEGMNDTLTISQTKNGSARVENRKDTKLYLIIDTKKGYTRRGNGEVFVQNKYLQNFKVIQIGNSADGDAGRIGYAMAYVIEIIPANGSMFFAVKMGGGHYKEYFLIIGNKILCLGEEDQVPVAIDELGINIQLDVEDFISIRS